MAIPLRVLIIEDSDSDAALDVRELEGAGYQITHEIVSTANKMKTALHTQTFDLIISDHNLPQFDSLKALGILKESGLDIPFIVVSGTIGEETAVKIMKAGAHDYVMKGNLSRLGMAVERELRDVEERRKHKQAEDSLRESEEKYSSLFANMINGFAYCKMFFDKDNKPVDFIYLEVNDAFEGITGLRKADVVGKRVTEAIPGIKDSNPELFDTYREVALTGKPTSFEVYVKPLDKWLAIWAYSPQKDYFGAVFDNITERKRAEMVILQNAERHRAILKTAMDGIWRVDTQGKLIEVNDSYCRMSGYSEQELLGMHISELEAEESSAATQAHIHKIVAQGSDRFESRHRRKDGSVFDVEVSAQYPTEGGPSFVVFIDDISSRKRAQDAVVRSEIALIDTQRFSHVGGWEWDIKNNKLTWSDEMYRLFGISQDIFSGDIQDVIAKAIHPDDVEKVQRSNQLVINEGKALPLEYRVIWPDNSVHVIWAEAGELIRDKDNQPSILRGFAQDITERKMAEIKLSQAAKEWQSTFDSISDMISIHDRDFKLVRVNKAFADAFHKTPDDFVGKHCYEIMHGTDSPIAGCPFEKTLETSLPGLIELFEPHLGIWVQISTSPIFNEKGEVTAMVHTTRDVSEQKKLQEQLMAQDRLASIGQLVAGVAHEINNPLTGVIGFSELLLQRKLPKDIKDDLQIISDEAKRTALIVRNLLTFARQQPQGKAPVEINEQIQKVLNLRQHEMLVNNIQVIAHFAQDLPQITANASQLQQVFFNIVTNAEQAMLEAHHRGTLTITTERVGDTVRVSLADDGPGISPDNMNRLFTPFFTTKGVGKGTGLGLSICHGIITEHGGKIYAESEPGKGATFVVEILVKEETNS